MFELSTARLRLIAPDEATISLLIENPAEMGRQLGLSPVSLELPEDFQAELRPSLEEFCLPNMRAYPEHYLWFTHWLIIHQAHNCRIGGIGGSGLPNEAGEIMIGYYISRDYEGQGLATEATTAFCQWLKGRAGLRTIIATTPIGHLASERVLQKSGFLQVDCEEEGLNRWELRV